MAASNRDFSWPEEEEDVADDHDSLSGSIFEDVTKDSNEEYEGQGEEIESASLIPEKLENSHDSTEVHNSSANLSKVNHKEALETSAKLGKHVTFVFEDKRISESLANEKLPCKVPNHVRNFYLDAQRICQSQLEPSESIRLQSTASLQALNKNDDANMVKGVFLRGEKGGSDKNVPHLQSEKESKMAENSGLLGTLTPKRRYRSSSPGPHPTHNVIRKKPTISQSQLKSSDLIRLQSTASLRALNKNDEANRVKSGSVIGVKDDVLDKEVTHLPSEKESKMAEDSNLLCMLSPKRKHRSLSTGPTHNNIREKPTICQSQLETSDPIRLQSSINLQASNNNNDVNMVKSGSVTGVADRVLHLEKESKIVGDSSLLCVLAPNQRHRISSPGPTPNNTRIKPTICSFYLKDRCTRGNFCQFLHQKEGSKRDYILDDKDSNEGGECGIFSSMEQPAPSSVKSSLQCDLQMQRALIRQYGVECHSDGPYRFDMLSSKYFIKDKMHYEMPKRKFLTDVNSVFLEHRYHSGNLSTSSSLCLNNSYTLAHERSAILIHGFCDSWESSVPFQPTFHYTPATYSYPENQCEPLLDSIEPKFFTKAEPLLHENCISGSNKQKKSFDGVENAEPKEENGDKGENSKESKETRIFRAALVEFVKQLVKPFWCDGYISKDVHKKIVKKAEEKVISAFEWHQVPNTAEAINQYLSTSRPKLLKLVEGYVGKYAKSKPLELKCR